MYCKYCGKEVDGGSFCPYCGKIINYEDDDDFFSASYKPKLKTIEKKNSGKEGVVIVALILAIFSFSMPLLFIVAIILGFIGLKTKRRGMAITSILLGIVAGAINILIIIIAFPKVVDIINKERKNKAIEEVKTVFIKARVVLMNASFGKEYSCVTHEGDVYSVTVTSLLNEGLIEYNPFKSTSSTGGMTVTYDDSTFITDCIIDGTVNGFTITYNGLTFE